MHDYRLILSISVVLILTIMISVIIGLLKGKAIYKKEIPSIIAQLYAQDIVTLFIMPLYIYSLILLYNDSIYESILIAGIAGYLLYTYASYSFFCYFNKLFLINVTAFSLSLLVFVLGAIQLIDVMNNTDLNSNHLLVGGGIWFIIIGCFILFLWLSQLLPATIKDAHVAILDESQGKLTIQALDLGLLAPAWIVFGILLISGNDNNYVQAWFFILLAKGMTLGLAVTIMAINQTREGYPNKPGILIFSFLSFIQILLFLWVLLEVNVSEVGYPVSSCGCLLADLPLSR